MLRSSRMILTTARLDLTLSLGSLFEPSGSPYSGDVTAVRLFLFWRGFEFCWVGHLFHFVNISEKSYENGSVSLQLCKKTLGGVSYHFKYIQKYTKK